MAYNNYYNPYSPYNNFNPYMQNYNPYSQPQMQPQVQPQQMQVANNANVQQQPNASAPQIKFYPLTFVNGIEGAKTFVVGTNSIAYLKDSDSNLLFEKRVDNEGKPTIIAFELKQVDINNIGKNNDASQKVEVITKEDLKPFITKDEFNAFKEQILSEIDKSTKEVKNVSYGHENNVKRDYNQRNNFNSRKDR